MVQIDMELPKKCMWDCPLCKEDGGACQLVDIKTSDTNRPSDCPLKEVPTGKWYRQSNDYVDYYECSNCGMAGGIYDVKNYCPNCGSRNVVEEQQGENI